MTKPFPTVAPPDIEALGVAFFSPLMTPTPVASRLPDPLDRADTVGGFLRIEAAGGVLDADGVFFTLDVIVHSYSPNEVLAAQVAGRAIAHAANARGTTITLAGEEWYVTDSTATPAIKQADPSVAMTRYKSLATWKVPGALVV